MARDGGTGCRAGDRATGPRGREPLRAVGVLPRVCARLLPVLPGAGEPRAGLRRPPGADGGVSGRTAGSVGDSAADRRRRWRTAVSSVWGSDAVRPRHDGDVCGALWTKRMAALD